MATETTVVSFRMPTSEYRALEQAATAAGESIAEYIRKAIALFIGGGQPVRIFANTAYAAKYTHAEVPATSTSSAPRNVILEEYVRQ